jgi:NAD(P)H-flavin reductase
LKENVCFVATGTGIVPVLSMVESFSKDFDRKIKIIFGLREEKDLFYVERIENLKSKFKDFSSVITLSRPTDSWKGDKGRVTSHLKNIKKDAQYFVCGSGAMINDVRKTLKEKGVKKGDVFFENFNE